MFGLMPGPFVTDAMLDPSALGFEFLGDWTATATQSSAVTITTARTVEGLLLLLSVPGMSTTTSQVGIRFNADAGLNYHHRNFTSPAVLGGLASFDNAQAVSQGEINLYGTTGTDAARIYQIFVMNKPNVSHLCVWQTAIVAATGAANSQVGNPNFGGGEWFGPLSTTQITSIDLLPLNGGGFLLGTTMQVFGGDL